MFVLSDAGQPRGVQEDLEPSFYTTQPLWRHPRFDLSPQPSGAAHGLRGRNTKAVEPQQGHAFKKVRRHFLEVMPKDSRRTDVKSNTADEFKGDAHLKGCVLPQERCAGCRAHLHVSSTQVRWVRGAGSASHTQCDAQTDRPPSCSCPVEPFCRWPWVRTETPATVVVWMEPSDVGRCQTSMWIPTITTVGRPHLTVTRRVNVSLFVTCIDPFRSWHREQRAGRPRGQRVGANLLAGSPSPRLVLGWWHHSHLGPSELSSLPVRLQQGER